MTCFDIFLLILPFATEVLLFTWTSLSAKTRRILGIVNYWLWVVFPVYMGSCFCRLFFKSDSFWLQLVVCACIFALTFPCYLLLERWRKRREDVKLNC